MDYALHIALTIFHGGFVLFILTGWIWRRTRATHAVLLGMTALSWFGLGLFFGVGYCFLTDWHWRVLNRLGATDLPHSFIKYMADGITGGDWSPILIDVCTGGGFVFAVVAAIWTNLRDARRDGRLTTREDYIALGFATLSLLSAIFGLMRAMALRWTADDAFITFRYAQNWARGLGPVFNAGERVEGYTNFLWLVLLTPFAGRADLEVVAMILGILCYTSLLVVIGAWGRYLTHNPGEAPGSYLPLLRTLPLALPAIALHKHLSIYGTSGLETPLFTLLITAGFLVLFRARALKKASFATGVWFLTGACLARPDGLLFLVLAAGFIAYALLRAPGTRYRNLPRLLLGSLWPFLLIYPLYWTARFTYYGLPWPNTFYAKSAASPYFTQGFTYLGLYFASYWPLAVIAIAGGAGIVLRTTREKIRPDAAIVTAGAVTCAWCAYIVYVGGDFMFARFLIPITPLIILFGEASIRRAWPWLSRSGYAFACACLFATTMLLRFDPYAGKPLPVFNDVSEEHIVYSRANRERLRQAAFVLKPVVQAADPVLAFYGSQAALVYYWNVSRAIEAETGLTDSGIASRTLDARGRIGHEKRATRAELLDRGVDWIMRPPPKERDFARLRARGIGSFEILCFRSRVMRHLTPGAGFQYDIPPPSDPACNTEL